MSSPKIAVVIPGYNHEAFIGDTIASVLAQEWPNLELHVLDDGSSDDTAGAAERALHGQNRVPYRVERQDNQGSGRTLNRLIDRVDADYVAVLNSDDLYHPQRLRRLIERAGDRDLSFAFTAVGYLQSGAALDTIDFDEWYRDRLNYCSRLPTCGFGLLTGNITISSSNFFFSRELFDLTGGFEPALTLTQDWNFAVSALRWTEAIFVPERLLTYRVHPGNTWRRLTEVRREQSLQVLRNYAAWATQPALNGDAPTPVAWPGFFPYFARICRANLATGPIAEHLPSALIDFIPDGTMPARDQAAIMELVAASRLPLETDESIPAVLDRMAKWQSPPTA